MGDAFLFVWKITDDESQMAELKCLGDETDANYKKLPQGYKDEMKYLTDAAVLSSMKIIAKINCYTNILAYRKHKELNIRLPDFKVKMGFGLHLGWAIEGLIGSSFKIDASYLSPNVNMAARFEAATKQYGVHILFSA
jgi:class 3 adenylate cyclase